jgi:hypothetical protein
MSISMQLHGAKIEIAGEYPENGLSVTLRITADGDPIELALWFRKKEVEQWWVTRSSYPRASDYMMMRESGNALKGPNVDDAIERHATNVYNDAKEELIRKMRELENEG